LLLGLKRFQSGDSPVCLTDESEQQELELFSFMWGGRRYSLRSRMSKIYDDISPCLYAERQAKSIFRLKGENKLEKPADA
jgi:hypothetical protein